MRRDENVENAIASDRHAESQTACCIRNDHSGCVQASRSNCSVWELHSNITAYLFSCSHLFYSALVLKIKRSQVVHLAILLSCNNK